MKIVVCSNDTPAALAIGATNFMVSLNFVMSKPDDIKDFAITSTTLFISEASKPNPLNVAPATTAASAKSVSVATARFNVAS